MNTTKLLLPLLLITLALGACAPDSAGTSDEMTLNQKNFDCPITETPKTAFELPKGYQGSRVEPFEGMFWYGTADLWTMLQEDGIWEQLPQDEDGFTQKLGFWWEGYDWRTEPSPNFYLRGERLGGEALNFETRQATNAYTPETGSTILLGVVIPSEGCWKITGEYRGVELSFVVDLRP